MYRRPLKLSRSNSCFLPTYPPWKPAPSVIFWVSVNEFNFSSCLDQKLSGYSVLSLHLFSHVYSIPKSGSYIFHRPFSPTHCHLAWIISLALLIHRCLKMKLVWISPIVLFLSAYTNFVSNLGSCNILLWSGISYKR